MKPDHIRTLFGRIKSFKHAELFVLKRKTTTWRGANEHGYITSVTITVIPVIYNACSKWISTGMLVRVFPKTGVNYWPSERYNSGPIGLHRGPFPLVFSQKL